MNTPMHRGLIRALAVALLAACCFVAHRAAQAAAAPTITIYRQVDQAGPSEASDTVRASDYCVWARLGWAEPLKEAVSYDTCWTAPDGTVAVKDTTVVKAGATESWVGIYIRGRGIAKTPGACRFTLLAQGGGEEVAHAVFRLDAAVTDPNKPKVSSTLCQGADEKLQALGKTRAFFSDGKAVMLVYQMGQAPAAGHTLVLKAYAANGDLAALGDSLKTDGKADKFLDGFLLAGQEWARNGGKFSLKLFWDEDPDPLYSQAFTVSTANRWALLIGINDYPPKGDGGSDLVGCDQDVARMSALLQTGFGFPASHLTQLRDTDATKANIINAVQALAKKAGPNDAVVIYYSGHGAQAPDLNGDEEDGWDEAIVPAEVVPNLITTETELNRLITDDEIAGLLRGFTTRNVTVIFDSCHSGTAVRAADPAAPPAMLRRNRFRDFTFGRELMKKAEAVKQQPAPDTDAAGLDIGKRFVFLAGCRPWEFSGCDEDGGFFTSTLVPELALADGESWDEIMQRVGLSVMNDTLSQYPVAEGAVRRLPFSLEESGTEAAYQRPSVAVSGAFAVAEKGKDDPPKKLTSGNAGTHQALVVGQGTLYFEQIGGLYDVYTRADQGFASPRGQVRITGDRQEVAIIDDKGDKIDDDLETVADILSGSVREGDRLVPAAIPMPAAKPKAIVTFDDKDDKNGPLLAAARALYNTLRADGALQVMDAGKWDEIDYVVEPRSIKDSVVTYIWSSGGWMMGRFNGTNEEMAAKTDVYLATRHAQYTRLVRLSNPSAPFRLQTSLADGDRLYAAGETTTVRVIPAADCYLSAIMISPDGEPVLLGVGTAVTAAKAAATFPVTLPATASGHVGIKILATKSPLPIGGLGALPASGRADAILTALQEIVGRNGGGERFLSTEGWADATVWIDLKK